jgi:DNA-directed RNA polymerase subunit alpha
MAGHHGCYEIGPVGAALSVPLASGLRRVFLASLEGAAITSVQIGGVQHEFQDIPEVLEDVTDIVLHFKKVRLRSFQCVLCICIWMYRGKAW